MKITNQNYSLYFLMLLWSLLIIVHKAYPASYEAHQELLNFDTSIEDMNILIDSEKDWTITLKEPCIPEAIPSPSCSNPNPIMATVSSEIETDYELIEDGSFEDNILNPYISGTTGSYSTSQAYDGSRSYKINLHFSPIHFFIPIQPDHKKSPIQISYMVKAASKDSLLIIKPYATTSLDDLDHALYEGPTQEISGSSWQQVSFEITPTSNYATIYAGFVAYGINNTLYVDSFSATSSVWAYPTYCFNPTITVGEINVPMLDVNTVLFRISIHIEDVSKLETSRQYFAQKRVM